MNDIFSSGEVNQYKTTYYVYFGLVGWDDQDKGFYPEDLPEDWHLAFYNTQFRCVYLPLERWIKASDKDFDIWLTETNESFRFILESPNIQTEKASQLIQGLIQRDSERILFDSSVDVTWVENHQDLRELASLMQTALERSRPLYVILRSVNPTLMRQVNELMEVLGV